MWNTCLDWSHMIFFFCFFFFADIDECLIPELASKCVANAECCNLPGHYFCKCKDGFTGQGDESCSGMNQSTTSINRNCTGTLGASASRFRDKFSGHTRTPFEILCLCFIFCPDIDECSSPYACGTNAVCTNFPGNYTCSCVEGFVGDPYTGVSYPCLFMNIFFLFFFNGHQHETGDYFLSLHLIQVLNSKIAFMIKYFLLFW
jgi:hypothetical protein